MSSVEAVIILLYNLCHNFQVLLYLIKSTVLTLFPSVYLGNDLIEFFEAIK
jgi:hypothetical protein